MANYTNPHNGQVMKAVYVDAAKLHAWQGWKVTGVDYSKPFGIMGETTQDDYVPEHDDNTPPERFYQLIQHAVYTDGLIIQCPVRFTRDG